MLSTVKPQSDEELAVKNRQGNFMNTTPVLQGAIGLLNQNFSVLPVNSADHSDPSKAKRPILSRWKALQSKAMTPNEARTLFVNGCSVAIIGGQVSGNTECLDFDDPELFKPYLDTLEGIDQRLANCLAQRKTPNGGYHLIYRCIEPVSGNTVLARQENGKVAIETRGEGGYFLTSPSPGYQVLQHSLKDIATITADERNVLIGLAKAFNTKQEPHKQERQYTSTGRPGDDFNEKHNHDIPAMLEKHGWTRSGRTGPGGEHWCRPEKDRGTSATLKNGCFYVFTSNAYPFEPMQSYSAFGTYTCLLHGGDYGAATRELSKKGYGKNTCGATPPTAEDKKQEWQEPLPVKSELPPVANLTEEMIPAPFRLWVMDAADRMQIPPDFIIAPLIVVCGSIIGTSCRIRPKQKDDWPVTPNMWGGIVGPPSMLKTPALTEAVNKTLGRLEVAAREDHAEKFSEYEADAMLDAARVKAIKAAIEKTAKLDRDGKNKGKSLEELAGELKDLQSSKPPTEKRYKTNDSSIEKIVELLEQNPRGLLYFRDELIGLFKRTERTGNEQDRAFLLESWNGDGSHTDDRIGRGTVRCDNLCISLLGGIQPDKISGYLHSAISEGENDGFVQRLQLMVYPDPVRDWQYQDKAPDLDARNRAYNIIENLAAMVVEGEDLLEGPYLRFSEEAQ